MNNILTNIPPAPQKVKSTQDKVLKTKCIPEKLTWESFQKRTIANLRRLYDDMGEDEPFLQKAATRYLEARSRRTSSISSQGQGNDSKNSRVTLSRLEAVSKKLDCGSLENGDLNVVKIKEELKQVSAKVKEQSPSKKTPAVSPIGRVDNKEESSDESDDEVKIVTSTPHPQPVNDSTADSSWKDKPSTSSESNPWRERPSIERRAKQKQTVENKENNSPKRGKQIRDYVYQPGRLKRTGNPPNGSTGKNKYIEWSSDEEADDNKPNIFKTHLPHKRVRKSLDLEECQPLQYHKIRRPAQRIAWTKQEEEKLREGVTTYGKGNWAVFKEECGFVFRTSVNLKDKWRNMTKGSGGDS